MKRLLSFLLLFVHLFSSPGLGYSMHYCGQVLTGVSVSAETPKSCCPPQKAPCGKCHDKHVSSPSHEATLLATAAFAAPAPALLPAPLAVAWPAAPSWAAQRVNFLPRPAGRDAAPPPWPAYVRGHAFRL